MSRIHCKIYVCIHLKVHYMQAECVKKGFGVRIVYSTHSSEMIYLAHRKKRNAGKNKYDMAAWEDHLHCCL